RRKAALLAQRLAPAIGERREAGIEAAPELLDDVRQGIAEILILAFAEAMAAHDDARAERPLIGIERAQRAALPGIEEARRHGIAALIERGGKGRPAQGGEAVGGDGCQGACHARKVAAGAIA